MIPPWSGEGLADMVDAFCDGIAFSVEETRRVFEAARKRRPAAAAPCRAVVATSAARLAAEFGALSADHVEYASEEDAAAMGRAGHGRRAAARRLPHAAGDAGCRRSRPSARHGVAMAVSTDANPGSSPMTSLLLAMNMACVLFRLTVPEVIAGVTREAARALGLLGEIGTLEAGKSCDLAIWSVERLAELPYRMGARPLDRRIFAGEDA